MKEGWLSRPLREVCAFIGRGVAPSYVNEGGVLVVNQRCVRDHAVDYTQARRHGAAKRGVPAERFLQLGDVLVNSTGVGTLGRLAQVKSVPPEPTTVDTHVTIVRPKPGLFVDAFFGYAMASIERKIEEAGEGSGGQTELSRAALGDRFEVTFPTDLAEQARIVRILDEALTGAAEIQTLSDKTGMRARELLDVRTGDLVARKGQPRRSLRLDAICLGFEYGTSSKSQPKGIVPVLRMGNLQDGEIDWEDLVFTSDPEEIAKFRLRPGDVLFNRTNSVDHVGKAAIYRGERDAIFAGYLIRVNYDPEELDPEFLNLYLNERSTREYGRSVMAKSVNQANISASKLRGYPISVPPLDEQTAIASELLSLKGQVKDLLVTASSRARAIDELRDALLDRAFAGRL